MLCKCRTQDVTGLQGSGDPLWAYTFFHSMNPLHLWFHRCKMRDILFSGTGRKVAQGSSQLFSLLDFSDEIKPLPANSQCAPHSYLDYQVFSSSLSKSYLPWRLSQLSSTGDLVLQLLGGRLFPFGGGRNSPCCPFHAPWGLIPFSRGFVPPLSVATQGRARWGTKFHNTCLPCRQYTQLQGMSHAQEPPLPPHIQL